MENGPIYMGHSQFEADDQQSHAVSLKAIYHFMGGILPPFLDKPS
jgi:hypothetical protein